MSKLQDRLETGRISSICDKCTKRQNCKYEKYTFSDGKPYEKFSVKCDGIPDEYFGKVTIERLKAKGLTDDEIDEARCMVDPASWAKKYLRLADGTPWIPRWYQEEMLRCSAPRKVSR